MNIRYIAETEINQHQLDLRTGAHRARHSFTIAGIRQLLGNTFIALGTKLHGHQRGVATNQHAVPAHAA